jgi:DNA-binding NarL/FixJ family response regulator
MDIKMPGINGIERTRLIHQKHPEIKVIILTIYDDAEFVTSSIDAGASGYLMKNATRNKIMRCINHVVNDGSFLDPSVTTSVLDFIKQDKAKSVKKKNIVLTKRELEVL